MENNGWFKINRSLIESPLWNDINTFRLYVLLLSKAAHKEIYVAGIKLNKGQYLRSYSKLAEDLAVKEGRGLKKISKSTVSRSIKKLISFGLVAEHETEHGTVFTILESQENQGFTEVEKTNPEQNMNRTQNEPRTKTRIKRIKRIK